MVEVLPGLPSFDWITDRLAVGSVLSRPTPGFAAVVTVLRRREMDELTADGTRLLIPEGAAKHLINHADRTPGLAQHLDRAVRFIDLHIQAGAVLIHCQAGVSRSPSVAIAYLMSTGMSRAAAISLVRSKRPEADPWLPFLAEIGTWAEERRRHPERG